MLGPFWVEDARVVENGDAIAGEDKGEPMLVKGRILDMDGKPIPNCLIETWETVSPPAPALTPGRGRLLRHAVLGQRLCAGLPRAAVL